MIKNRVHVVSEGDGKYCFNHINDSIDGSPKRLRGYLVSCQSSIVFRMD